jgi:hypothetical protein
MTTEALKAPSITNLDSTPVVQNTTGAGAPGMLQVVGDSVTATTAKTAGSTYQLARFPTAAIVKHCPINLDATVTTFTVDIDVAYSDSAVDGTPVSDQGGIVQISAADNKIFGAAVDLHLQVTPLDVAVTLTAANKNKPMWQVLGLTSDPGGYFDLTLKTTATTSGAPVVYGEVQYVL